MDNPKLRDIVENLPIKHFECSGLGVQDVLPHVRRWLLTKVKPDRETSVPQCLIVYDYIKLATVNELRGGKLQEYQLHGLNLAAMHDFVKKFNVPCLTFGQTNNEVDDDVKCIAGAKRIIENVSSVTLLKKKTEDEVALDPNGTHLARVFMTRFGGGTPNSYINIGADLSWGNFTELNIGTVNFAAEQRRRVEEWRRNRNGNRDNDDED